MYQVAGGYGYINNGAAALLLGAGGNNNLGLDTNGTSKFNNDLQIGSGPIGGTGARLKVRGSNLSSGTYTVLFENAGGQEAFRVENDRQTYTKRLNVTGLGGTSATTALLVENSSATEAFKILDNLAIIMANLPTSSSGLATGQIWNNSGVLNIA